MILRPASLRKAYSLCSTTQPFGCIAKGAGASLDGRLLHQFLVRLLPYLCPPPSSLPNSRLSIHEKAKGKGPNSMRWKNSKRKTTEQLTAGPSCLSQIRHFFATMSMKLPAIILALLFSPFHRHSPERTDQCPVRLGC